MKKIILTGLALFFSFSFIAETNASSFSDMLDQRIANLESLAQTMENSDVSENCLDQLRIQIGWLREKQSDLTITNIIEIRRFSAEKSLENSDCIKEIKQARIDQLAEKIKKLSKTIKNLASSGEDITDLENILETAQEKLSLMQSTVQ